MGAHCKHGAARSKVERGQETPLPCSPLGNSNAQNVEDLLKVGEGFISKDGGIPTGVSYRYSRCTSI